MVERLRTRGSYVCRRAATARLAMMLTLTDAERERMLAEARARRAARAASPLSGGGT